MAASKSLAIILIAACAALGGYEGMVLSIQHGFFDALKTCTSLTNATGDCILDARDLANVPAYTGIPAIDGRFAVLFEFFARGLTHHHDGDIGSNLSALLAMSYLAAQFGGAWYLLVLEGLRKGNARTLSSYTGTYGIIFQIITITIVAPVVLIFNLVRYRNPYRNTVTINSIDLKLVPLSFGIAFLLPTIGLILPLLDALSPVGKYFAIAIWQPFPLYQSVIHWTLRFFKQQRAASPKEDLETYKGTLNSVYRFILRLTIGIHIAVLGTIAFCNLTGWPARLSATAILFPSSLTNPATLALLEPPPVAASTAQRIVLSFLQWDVYCCSAALAIWAAYLLRSVKRRMGLLKTLATILQWTLIGGPVTPAIVMLWQRDLEVLEAVDYWGIAKTE